MPPDGLLRVLGDLLAYQNWWNATSPAKDQAINAAGVALRRGDRLMFVRHAERGTWEFPGGVIEPGETPEQAAQREAIEEAGAPDGLTLEPAAEIDHNGVHYTLFVAAVPDEYHPHLADRELDDWLWTSPESAPGPLHPGLPEAMGCLAQDVLAQDALLAFDRGLRTYDANGHLNVAASNISKSNICEYYGHEIPDAEKHGLDPGRRYRLYRDPDELAKAVHTFNRLPILSRHQPVSSDDHPKHLVVGTTGSEASFEHPYLRNSLSVWDQDAIDRIEAEDQKQLSAAYRYRADMTPGTVDGHAYDGVMRDIHGNHIALVPEGRAGADVVVGDSKPQERDMPALRTARMSRQALYVSAACSALLLPKLATDQKMPDIRSLLKGVTQKNWKQRRPAFIEAVIKAAKPRLAADNSIEALAQLLNTLEVEAPVEEVQDQLEPIDENPPPNGAQEPIKSEEATDHGGLPEQIAAKLEEWLTPEQMAELRAMAGNTTEPPPNSEEPPPPNGEEPNNDQDPDEEERKRKEQEMQNKPPPAMDAAAVKKLVDGAVTTAVTKERDLQRKHYRDMREAEENIRPWVGKVAVAQDCAADYYKLALDTLGVSVDDVHPSAYWPLLQRLPKPSEQQQTRIVAMDEAQTRDFVDRYPGAASLKRI